MSESLLDPEVSRKLAECMNTKEFLDLPEKARFAFQDAYLSGKTTDDLPQIILDHIGYKEDTRG